MFDHIDPRLFWPGLVLVWFLASLVAGMVLGRIFQTFNR